jgi:thymidylate kinase
MAKFIMVDGLDGSGKGVVVDSLKEWALKKKLSILDLRDYWKTKQGFPDIINYDVIISAEPTFTGWGKKLRENLIKTGSKASKEEIAEAYSKDRKDLYKNIIIPALKQNKFIFQERGIVSSLVYQSVQGIPVDDLLALDGNRFCMDYLPDFLILTVVNPEVVIERLGKKGKKG